MGRFPTTLSLFLSFLIILLHTNIILIADAQGQLAHIYVLDSNGDFVQPGVDYYIQPLSAGGTIGLSSAPNGTCPLDPVLQTGKNALPVKFSPVNSDNSNITTNNDMNIEFSASTICVTSTVWKIQPSTNGTTTTYFVTTGGVKGNPGRATLYNWFRIQQGSDNRYYIYFCPTVCNTCRPVCGNIGLIPQNGRTRLGITSPPLQVQFVRTN